MTSAAFDSSSESADNFTYAMFAAGTAYRLCDMMERYSQMQNERTVANPFEIGITDAINILNGTQTQSQVQSQNNLVSQLCIASGNKVSDLGVAHKEIADLKQTIVEKNKNISDLTQERDQLLDQETVLSIDNELKNKIIAEKDEEIAKLSVNRKGEWQEMVLSRNTEGRKDRGNSI